MFDIKTIFTQYPSHEEWECEIEVDNVAAGRHARCDGKSLEDNPWNEAHVGNALSRVHANRAAAWREGYNSF